MLRPVAAILLFLSSLLCIFPAPIYWLWYAAILVSELPWIFIIACLLLLIFIFRNPKYRMVSAGFCAAALCLFVSPVIGAYRVAARLPNDITQAFSSLNKPNGAGYHFAANSSTQPFRFTQMLTGIFAQPLPYSTLSFPAANDDMLTLDYYPAQIAEEVKLPRPCVVVIHGGSWAAGDSRQLPELNTVLAEHGLNVATINYRLAPKFHYPAPEEDIVSAIRYLRGRAGELNMDTSQIILLGRSAGGQLALDVACNARGLGIRGAISYYGPADMVWGYQHSANPLVLDSKKVMEDFLGGTYEQLPERYVHSSATYDITPATVPMLLIQGKNDPLVAYEHAVRLDDTLAAKGVPHYFLSLPWATHGCDYTLNGPSGQLATYSVLYFLGKVLR